MKKYFFMSLFLISYSLMSSSSWFEGLRNAFSFSSVQSPEQEQLQKQQELPLAKLTSRQALELELRHLDSLNLEDQIAALEIDLRHLQSLNIKDEMSRLNQQKDKINARLLKLEKLAQSEHDAYGQLLNLSQLLARKKDIIGQLQKN